MSLAQPGGSYDFDDDPKHLAFTASRYKFVAKMLAGKSRVLEVGCGEGLKSRIVRQAVGHLTAFDADAELIARIVPSARWPIEFQCRDALGDYYGAFDAVYTLDLFEHIAPADEHSFLFRLRDCAPVCIIGTPSAESQPYASPGSKEFHVNCLSGEDLRAHCQPYWRQVFMFGMNDEVVHTGFFRMANYLFALCVA